jgi:hypothetical protein
VKLPVILALDPGGTTGVCLYRPWETALWQGHIGPGDHHLRLWELLSKVYKASAARQTPLTVVCEAFEFRKTERHRDFINYIPREYIGVCKLFWEQHQDTRFVQQSPMNVIPGPSGHAFWTDDKVKQLGLWVPGLKHAMDATRHYLYHRVFTLRDKSLLLKLR